MTAPSLRKNLQTLNQEIPALTKVSKTKKAQASRNNGHSMTAINLQNTLLGRKQSAANLQANTLFDSSRSMSAMSAGSMIGG
jgi:hypothetical protein